MRNKIDLLSNLPDVLLLLIMAYLPTKFAIRTSILSKRWRDLWTQIHDLDFDENLFIEDHRPSVLLTIEPREWVMHEKNQWRVRFVDFVHRSLLCYKSDRITRFCLRFHYNPEYYPHINQWLNFAIKRGVQELDLDFLWGGNYRNHKPAGCRPFELPNYFFSYQSLIILRLRYCTINPLDFTIFASLKSLSLVRIRLSSELLVQVLGSCSALKILHLENCLGMTSLNIVTQSLQLESLSITDWKNSPLSEVQIRVPNLKVFQYSGSIIRFDVTRLPYLVEVVLDFWFNSESHKKSREMAQLLSTLDNIMVLTVSSCLQIRGSNQGCQSGKRRLLGWWKAGRVKGRRKHRGKQAGKETGKRAFHFL
ncbi:F-box/LRR-repeat protein 25-like [Tasmannia lanceolata]|uniref:F-box/LRR-repeat protein 25-like n=1 Tax=Tasmannia lanceolata TaxID=3420 RepID=UPI004063A5A0